jgi:hypothetical protein
MSDLPLNDLENWRELPPEDRAAWWSQLWLDAASLADRYRLSLRSGWWEDSIQVEALQAFAAWARLYDSGSYTDPPGKLQLLFELERLRAVLRAGEQPLDASRDRPLFDRYVQQLNADEGDEPAGAELEREAALCDRQAKRELASARERLAELRARERALDTLLAEQDARAKTHNLAAVRDERDRLRDTIAQLERRQNELRSQLDSAPGR